MDIKNRINMKSTENQRKVLVASCFSPAKSFTRVNLLWCSDCSQVGEQMKREMMEWLVAGRWEQVVTNMESWAATSLPVPLADITNQAWYSAISHRHTLRIFFKTQGPQSTITKSTTVGLYANIFLRETYMSHGLYTKIKKLISWFVF